MCPFRSQKGFDGRVCQCDLGGDGIVLYKSAVDIKQDGTLIRAVVNLMNHDGLVQRVDDQMPHDETEPQQSGPRDTLMISSCCSAQNSFVCLVQVLGDRQ